jgi:hypothetical protein
MKSRMKQMTQMVGFEGENGFSSEKVFCFFLQSQNKLRSNKAI